MAAKGKIMRTRTIERIFFFIPVFKALKGNEMAWMQHLLVPVPFQK
jgi:hypothetical protein